ncbi:hypothetical protein KIPB_014048, partial [Kipferlia bialata]|eukprot:g14048.t1
MTSTNYEIREYVTLAYIAVSAVYTLVLLVLGVRWLRQRGQRERRARGGKRKPVLNDSVSACACIYALLLMRSVLFSYPGETWKELSITNP